MDVLMLFLSNLIGNNKKYWKIMKLAHIAGNFVANVIHLYCRSLEIELLSVIHLLITIEMLREWDPEI